MPIPQQGSAILLPPCLPVPILKATFWTLCRSAWIIQQPQRRSWIPWKF